MGQQHRTREKRLAKAEHERHLLAELVLTGNMEAVKAFLEKSGPFASMGTALEFACRYAGSAMVELLLSHGASFTDSSSKKKPAYTAQSAFCGCSCLLRNNPNEWKIRDVQNELVPRKEQLQILKLLIRAGKSAEFDPSELLLYAVLQKDQETVRALRTLGITQLTGYARYVLAGGPVRGPETRAQTYLAAFADALAGTDDDMEELCRQMHEITGCPVRLHMQETEDAQKFLDEVEEEKMLSVLKHTTFAYAYGKQKMLRFIIRRGFESALDWLLQQNWVTCWSMYEELMDFAREQNASESMLGCLLKYEGACERGRRSSQERERNTNPFSVQSLRKVWGTKTLRDGTLRITSYKGGGLVDGHLTIPSRIGNKCVTDISNKAFKPDAGANASIRAARGEVHSLTIPGTIEHIPHLFMFWSQSLEHVIIEEGTKSIGASAFEQCRSLKTVVLPTTLGWIGEGAFGMCRHLTDMSCISPEVHISREAFLGCSSLPAENGILIVGKYAAEVHEEAMVRAWQIPEGVCVHSGNMWRLPVMMYYAAEKKSDPPADFPNIRTGDIVGFGQFPESTDLVLKPLPWVCAARDGNKAILVARDMIACEPAHWEEELEWEQCTLRRWLNGPFLEHAFQPDEKKRILPIRHGRCEDSVFVLSAEETATLFPDAESGQCVMTPYCTAQQYPYAKDKEQYAVLRPDKNTPDPEKLETVSAGGTISQRPPWTHQSTPYSYSSEIFDIQEARLLGIRPAMVISIY